MNKISNNSAILLPSDSERQKIFYWLKKVSSVTAWRRILEFYKSWANVAENSLRFSDERGWSSQTAIDSSHYVLILKGLAHCEEGVVRLLSGDKRVFKFDANGEFALARRVLFHWAEMTTRIEMGENVIDEKHTPLWLEFDKALTFACQAWQECGIHILESNYSDDPALTLYGEWIINEFKKMSFPKNLAAVPEPSENIFVRTKQLVPCSGIWEPIEVPRVSFMSMFTSMHEPKPPFEVAGAMNYLHIGSPAPRATIETATDNIDIDATWRLLWKDERYLNGNIPEEEDSYRFIKPEMMHIPASPTIVSEEIVWAYSGSPVPASGRWLVDSEIDTSMTLQKGQTLPTYNGRDVRWVLAEY